MTPKIQVVHVTQYLDIGGLETLIIEMCRKADRDRFAVGVLCLNGYDPAYCSTLEAEGIPLALIRKRRRIDPGFFHRVAAYFRRCGAQVVHAHGGCYLYSALAARLAGSLRMVYTAHGMPVNPGIQTWGETAAALAMTHRLVTVSGEIRAYYRNRFPFARGRTDLIINGVDTDRFHPDRDVERLATLRQRFGIPPEKFLIGSVGRLEPVKNYSLLIRAVERVVKRKGDAVHLIFFGDGSQRAALEEAADACGISGAVTFAGMQYNLHKILPMLDLFSLSSHTEGTSVSLLEAQACAIPAVVTDVGGNSWVIQNGANGWLCRPGDADDMARCIIRLMENPEEAAAMGRRSRADVQARFALKSMVRQYERLYERIVRQPGRGNPAEGRAVR